MKKIVLVMMSMVALLETGSLQSDAAQATFELYNKSEYELWFRLRNGTTLVHDYQGNTLFSSKPGKQIQLSPDINKPSLLEIWFDDPRSRKQDPDYIIELPTKKTLFLTYSGSGFHPETGPWLGLKGITVSGLSLKNNLQAKEVNITHTSDAAFAKYARARSAKSTTIIRGGEEKKAKTTQPIAGKGFSWIN